VVQEGRTLDEALNASALTIEARDRSFGHAIAAETLRHKGEAEAILRKFLSKPLPRSSGPAQLILILGVVQLVFMKVLAHAAIDVSVSQAQDDSQARHFAKLINAVLRKIAAAGDDVVAGLDAAQLNTPSWLMKSWVKAYGEKVARRIAESHLHEAALDLTVKADPQHWAQELDGELLPTGTVRLRNVAAVDQLPGYAEGDWWVQDAAAALPVLLLGEVRGKRLLDLCAAPGGKTAQMAARGGEVTAVDISAARLRVVADNLARLKLKAKLLEADAAALPVDQGYDGVLLDAPCSATGTIRRHPDLPYLKNKQQVQELALLQSTLLDRAALQVKPKGLLVYSTCSLQPEEGEQQVTSFLERNPEFSVEPVRPEELGGVEGLVSTEGHLRTLPFMAIGSSAGLDGFFAARLRRR
jgi:16S rRNA (cytosine967-C5)-methyltransferase